MTDEPDDPSQNYRDSDPDTSKSAGRRSKRFIQRDRMLAAVEVEGRPLIPYEAAVLTGLDAPGKCYWKRFSELHRDYHYLEPTGVERPGPSPTDNQTEMRITPAGREYLRKLAEERGW